VYSCSTSFEGYLGRTLLLGVAGGAQARGEPCPRGVQGFRKYLLPTLINSFKVLPYRQRENPAHVVARVSTNTGFPKVYHFLSSILRILLVEYIIFLRKNVIKLCQLISRKCHLIVETLTNVKLVNIL
jgi:hypothetical protein